MIQFNHFKNLCDDLRASLYEIITCQTRLAKQAVYLAKSQTKQEVFKDPSSSSSWALLPHPPNEMQQGKSEGFESCDRPIVRKHPIWVKIGDVLSRVTLKFDGWPWKTIGHLFFAVSSFVQHFIAIGEFKLELTVQKRPIWVKFNDF